MTVDTAQLLFHPSLVPPLGLASIAILGVCLFILYLRNRTPPEPVKIVKVSAADKETPPANAGPPKPRCLLLFGTQTGTAERFAKQLKTELTVRYGKDCTFDVVDAEEYKAEEQLAKEKLVFFLLATYGDGEPTDNAADLYNWVVRSAAEAAREDGMQLLQSVSFAVFGLGNKQYEHFCAVGKRMHKCMAALGATPVGPRGEGDDDDDIEADFDDWRAKLYEDLDKSALLTSTGETSPTQIAAADSLPSFQVNIFSGAEASSQLQQRQQPKGSGTSASNSFVASVTCVRELHQSSSDRSCLHIELDTSGSEMHYEAGDHVGILTENGDKEVREAAKLLGVDPETVFSLSLPEGNPGGLSLFFRGAMTLQQALRCHTDLLGPINKPAVQAFAAYASGDASAHLLRLLSPEGQADYKDWHKQSRCLLELMREFPAVRPPLGAFFGSIAPRLQVRFYSISSGPGLHPKAVHITCAYIREATPTGRLHEGVCSQQFSRLQPGDTVSAYIRRSPLHLPQNVSDPIVMVGPGTGLAPFRGFLQQRAHMLAQGQKLGPALLFFGCRNRKQDYIYEQELADFQQGGAVGKLFVAFSRDGAAKKYVQDHMLLHVAEVGPLLGPSANGHFYVCGDAKHMAKDVHRALQTVIQQHRACSAMEAEAAVQQLLDSGRYMRDVW